MHGCMLPVDSLHKGRKGYLATWGMVRRRLNNVVARCGLQAHEQLVLLLATSLKDPERLHAAQGLPRRHRIHYGSELKPSNTGRDLYHGGAGSSDSDCSTTRRVCKIQESSRLRYEYLQECFSITRSQTKHHRQWRHIVSTPPALALFT
jgi:hypothetical protein